MNQVQKRLPSSFSRKFNEECGVFGVYAPGADVARITFFGQFALQHRGQESAGIAVWNNGVIKLKKNLGLIQQVFRDDDLELLKGTVAIGHNRYSTTGSNNSINAGPFVATSDLGPVAVAHNGNLINTASLRAQLEEAHLEFDSTTDSELIAKSIAFSPGSTWVERMKNGSKQWKGAYSLTIIADGCLYAMRDPIGIRPLCYGKLDQDRGWVVASESCALSTVGAEYIGEVEPGEIVEFSHNGVKVHQFERPEKISNCIFEFIYFARPDSILNGETVYNVRKRMGAILWEEQPVDADVVVPVPDSGIPAAIGFSEASKIPFAHGLIKNRYIARTFINPDQTIREQGIALKLNPLRSELEGKRVVLIDDSIVRGSTTGKIVQLIKDHGGAKEVHVRISAPPITDPCFFGIDTANKEQLIAAVKTVPEIREHIHADSLGYMSIEGLLRSTNLPKDSFCLGCFTADYPIPVQLSMDKLMLEKS